MIKQTLINGIFLFIFASVALAQKMTVKDSDANVLMEVNDEGIVGSITLPSGSPPSTPTNKLYNVSGTLYWNGSALGTAGGEGGWTDEGTVVYLTTSTDKVGIGDSSPTHTLDVAGMIGINDTQIIYLPDQYDFTGTLYLGDGGGSLSHSVGYEGRYNTGVGIEALNANTTGYRNTACGYRALYANTSGDYNTASGNSALISNTTGNLNTASGYMALYSNTTGWRNTASGYKALYYNTGNDNTASGYQALYSNTTGNNNTGIGYNANYYNQEGSNNTIIGNDAGRGDTEHNKSGNVFIGYQAGYNETGSNKLYIENSNSSSPLIGGDFSADEIYLNGDVGIGTTDPGSKLDVNGTAEMTGFKLTTGASDGYVLTSDAGGVGTWQEASGGGGDFSDGGELGEADRTLGNTDNYDLGFLTNNQNRLHIQNDGNVGIGDTSPTYTLDVAGKIGVNDTQVLYLPNQSTFTGTLILGDGGGSLSHTDYMDGHQNTAVGIGALNGNTTGHHNTAIGSFALESNTTGSYNLASGRQTLNRNTTGSQNTASGLEALYYNTTGNYNTASGMQAFFHNTTGNCNTGIGYNANYYNQEGSNNTIIGYEAGKGDTEHNKSGNVFIGYQAGYNETGSNKLYIENSNSSTPLIGGDFSADEIYLNGDVGIGTTEPGSKLDVNGTAEMTGFKLTTGASDGYVLTSDASGVGTWQAASGGGLWESGTNGVYEDDAGVIVGIDQAETLENSGFSLAAGDLFVEDQLGVEGNVYTDGSFVAGSSLTLTDGSITQSTGSALNVTLGGAADDDFIVDTNTLVVESDNHRVGIGTTSPAQRLNVDGNLLLDGSLYFPNNPGSGFRYGSIRQGDFSGGHYPSHAEVNFDYLDTNGSSRAGLNLVVGGVNDGFLTLTTNNTERVRVDHTGNMGIGTTGPNSKLDVNGTAEMTGFKMPTGASSGYMLTSDASGVGTWQETSSGDTDWTISGSDMYSAVSGNVGIGTTAPNEKLVVQDGNFYIKNGNSHLRGVTGGARIEYHHDYGLDGSESYCEVAIQGIGTGDDALVVEAYRINGNGVGYGAAMGKQVWVMSCEAAGSTSPETIFEYPGEYDESSSDNISLTGEIGPILRVKFYKRYAYDNGNLMILLYGRFNPENAVFTATDY